jgi:hypothetical protein
VFIPGEAFYGCNSLTNVIIPTSVTNIDTRAFWSCASLTTITIPASVTSLGNQVFGDCDNLTSITIPSSITNIGYEAFGYCDKLTGVFFQGNAPTVGYLLFNHVNNVTVYYLPGTVGWSATFSTKPTKLWNPEIQTGDSIFGVVTNCFSFAIAGTPDIPMVIEASTKPTTAAWASVQTCTLTNGYIYFSDPQWTNYPTRFYRIRSP